MREARGTLRLAGAAALLLALAQPAARALCAPLCHCHRDHLSCSHVPFHRFPYIGDGVRHVSVVGAWLGALAAAALDARALSTLVLAACRLHHLEPGALASMEHTLASLDLGHNEFTEVPARALRDLKVLNWLDLQSNQIADLDPETEWGSLGDSLSSLSLANNQLRTLGTGALIALHRLAQLDLEGNRLLVVDALALPPSLAHLRLSDNLLPAPPCAALTRLPRLRRLQLRANALSSAPNASAGLNACRASALDELDLALNELDDASAVPAPHAPLRRLILDLNSFTAVPPWVLEGGARLERLSLSHNRLSRISEATTHALRSLVRFDLDHNTLRVAPDALRTLVALRHLDLAYNRLRALPQPPPHLRYLSLGGNLLTALPLGLRRLAPNSLEYLDVSYNRIVALTAAAFGMWASALTQLDLRGNRLVRLTVHAFPPTLPLRELALSFNDLDHVETGALSNLASLQTLEFSSTLFDGEFPVMGANTVVWLGLDNNGIRCVSANDLLAYPALEHLNLDFNKITEFPGDTLGANGTVRLRELRLASNYLKELQSEFLRSVPELRSVDLSHNRIRNVSARAFHELLALRRLGLAGNRLRYIAPCAFRLLPRLEELNLHDNLLVELRADSFDRVGELQTELTLNVSHNRIARLMAGKARISVTVLDLSHNRLDGLSAAFFAVVGTRLRRLTLSHNRLASLDSTTLGALPRLQVLVLDSGDVAIMRRRALADAPAVQVLDLSWNAIHQLAVEQFNGLRHLRHLRLAGNRLRALPRDCLRNTLLEHLDLNDNELSLFPQGALAAVGFTLRRLELARNRLEQLDMAALRCCGELTELSLAGNRLTMLASAALAPVTGLRVLDLSGNQLKTNLSELLLAVPHLRSLSLAGTGLRAAPALLLPELIGLDLSDNHITALRDGETRHLLRLRSLNLASNAFTSLQPAAWAAYPRLVDLDVSDNPIVRLPIGALDGLPRLRRLRLLLLRHLEAVEPRAFRSLLALRELVLEMPLGRVRASLVDLLAGTSALESLTLVMRDESLDDQLRGVRAPRLRALEVSGVALRAVSADAFASMGAARALTLRLRGTSVVRLPAGLVRPLEGVPHLALDFSDNELVEFSPTTLYWNLTGRNGLATKLLPGGLVVSGNPLPCGCAVSWLGAWLRRWTAEVAGGARGAAAMAGACAWRGARVPLVSLAEGEAACAARARASLAPRDLPAFLWIIFLHSASYC